MENNPPVTGAPFPDPPPWSNVCPTLGPSVPLKPQPSELRTAGGCAFARTLGRPFSTGAVHISPRAGAPGLLYSSLPAEASRPPWPTPTYHRLSAGPPPVDQPVVIHRASDVELGQRLDPKEASGPNEVVLGIHAVTMRPHAPCILGGAGAVGALCLVREVWGWYVPGAGRRLQVGPHTPRLVRGGYLVC